MKNNVRQVKFVDRTFNCNKNHALDIWKYIQENDNGFTNFHFELSADLIDDETIYVLKPMRIGAVQVEIGVQSTNVNTLNKIKRKTNTNIVFENVEKIKKLSNINIHLDLIVGLPDENYGSFKESFNDVYKYYPEQLQVGFLKVLRGSGLRYDASKYGILFREKAPYEVLATNDICFKEILKLKQVEEMVETFYNSNKFMFSIKYIVEKFESPFNMFEKLAEYWNISGYHLVSHSKMEIYKIMNQFCLKNNIYIEEFLKFDMLLCDNLKNLPNWMNVDEVDDDFSEKKLFYNTESNIEKFLPHLNSFNPRQLLKMCLIQKFNFDVCRWIDSHEFVEKEVYILFDYSQKIEIPGLASFHGKYYDITNEMQVD